MNLRREIQNIPKGIRLISWATAIRYIGWGFVEGLIPIFLFSFTGSYAESGLLSSVYDIIFIICLPLAGMLADRTASKKIIISGLILYPFIGLSYFIAGVTSMLAFVIIARVMNGFAYAFDLVGRNTYFRRHSSFQNASTVFGYFETLSTIWWLVAMIASLWLVAFVKIHYLFLLLIPTVLVAIFIITKLKSDMDEPIKTSLGKVFHFGYFLNIIKEIKTWDKGLRLITAIVFFLSFLGAIVEFIIPINAYSNGANIQYAISINIIFAIPTLFGFYLGKIIDKKREFGIIFGILLASLLFLAYHFVDFKPLQLLIFLGIGIAFQMVTLGCDGITTVIAKSKEFGVVSSIMSALADFGNIAGMVALGLIVDKKGMGFGIFTALTITTMLLFVIIKNKKYIATAMPVRYERGNS